MDNLVFKNGYYKVGNEIFKNKPEAVYRSNQVNLPWTWYFHDAEMGAFDWTVEPTESLNDLYYQRARQIREKYDYVIVFCSGGADSTNVLYSFLKNGLHVDEVVAGAPISGLKNWNWNISDNSAENTISETKYAQIPLLNEVSVNYPRTKVTLHDYFVDMLEYKTDEWLFKSGDYIHPTFAARYNLERDAYSYIRDIAESGKKVALVYGIDKPYLSYKNGIFYSYFRDSLVCNGFQSIEHNNVEVELFYYSPELVPMLIKQAHVAVRWIHTPGNEIYKLNAVLSDELIEKRGAAHRKYLGLYERAIVPTIYPMVNQGIFQCRKPISAFMGEHDAWFLYEHYSSRTRELIASDYNLFIKGLDGKHFRKDLSGNILGFRLAYKYHKIGLEKDFLRYSAV